MPYSQSGTASDYKDLLVKIGTFLETALPVAERYTAMRSVTSGAVYEKIWRAPGLSADKQIFFGIQTYENSGLDYYNYRLNGFTGYISDSTSFTTQPGARSTNIGVPLLNLNMPYWIRGNGQGFTCVVNVSTGYYQTITMGFLSKFGNFTQWPYPLLVGGMLYTDSATRFHVNTDLAWWKGNVNSMMLRLPDGSWVTTYVDGFTYGSTNFYRNTNNDKLSSVGYYALTPMELIRQSPDNVYGVVDGLFHISGYGMGPENTLTIDGVNYITFRDGAKSGLKDYIAMSMPA